MHQLTTRKPKPDPDALYEARVAFTDGRRVWNPGTRLRGDHEAVRAHFDAFMLASLPDDEKARQHASALWDQTIVEDHASRRHSTTAFPPAKRPSGNMQALDNWTIEEPALGGPRPLYAGTIVASDDPLYLAFPQLFRPVEPVR
jgi:hypothetical protein